MVIDDSFFINLAINEAWRYFGTTYPNPPVGAVVAIDDKILSIASHNKSGFAHAEVNAIKDAYYKLSNDDNILSLTKANDIHNYLYTNHNNLFVNATIYVTLEPCNHYGKTPPCAMLIENLGFKKVVIASIEKNDEAIGGAKRLQDKGIDVISGVLSNEADELLAIFYKTLANKPFVFFKYAQTISAKIDGGYISSTKSLEYVHKLRDRCDLIVIGGNTVRCDRPRLDARMIDGKAPDILIYSRTKDFDTSIPLFSIPNRDVYISDDLSIINNYKFVMIEGGNDMLNVCKNIIDYILIFIAPKMTYGGYKIDTDILIEYKNIQQISDDIMIWAKVVNK